jgi:hypothetical protein
LRLFIGLDSHFYEAEPGRVVIYENGGKSGRKISQIQQEWTSLYTLLFYHYP